MTNVFNTWIEADEIKLITSDLYIMPSRRTAMSLLKLESECRNLKETIIELRLRLEAIDLEAKKELEHERMKQHQVINQLEKTIIGLRMQLENLALQNLRKTEEIVKIKNDEIHQLQKTIKEMRVLLEKNLVK